jgi:putative tryptophan/tyrosine transport system substrate-binding protein
MRRREFIAGISAAAWPLTARAQQTAVPMIGNLSIFQANTGVPVLFLQGLAEQGYVEGRNIEILSRYAESHEDRLPALAEDLVRRQVAAIFVFPNIGFARIARNATATIPIVFAAGWDPVEAGLVASLDRPGGNVTGATFLTVPAVPKRLEIIHQMVPAATSIGYIINQLNPQLAAERREVEAAARSLDVRLVVVEASTPDELEAAFAALVKERVGAMLPAADRLFVVHGHLLIALAARHGLPAIYISRGWVTAGGLVSYGQIGADHYRIAGSYVGRILKGEKPADLPVQQSTRTEMVLNLKTAKSLGLTVPPGLLALADEVIE